MSKIKKFLLVVLIILVTILGVIAGYIYTKLEKLEIGTIDTQNLYISTNAKSELSRYENIALFAVDSRNIHSNVGSRSDGIIILSLDKITNKVNIVSVYRDTYVKIPGHGLDKITHAYAFGGPELAIQTLNLNFDLNITKYVTVNFLAVANIIDKLGGIEVEIDKEELAELNKYIPDTMKNTGLSSNTIDSVGVHNLDGVQAVTYARIRKITGGDFARNDRMREVISKSFEKLKANDVFKINSLLDETFSEIQTNLTKTNIIMLMFRIPFVKVNQSIGFPFETQGKTMSAYYGIPVTLETNVIELYSKIFGIENFKPSQEVINISNEIIQKTGIK